MNIRVLLYSNDTRYISRLAESIERMPPETGDIFEPFVFTDPEKLKNMFNDQSEKRTSFDIALVEADALETVSAYVKNILLFTNETIQDGASHGGNTAIIYLDKYQRVSDIEKKILLAVASNRQDIGGGMARVCTFFSPAGGSGTSTVAASFAIAAAQQNVRPLYISLEHFNATEIFFSNLEETSKGLYDVFYAVARGKGITATLDAVKSKDERGVSYLTRFPSWGEVAQRTPEEIETFVAAAKSASNTDIIVIDAGSAFTHFTETIFNNSDDIFVVSNATPTSELKLNSFFSNETAIYSKHIDKMNIIFNAANTTQTNSYGCKTVTQVPHILGATVENYLRGLINPLWSRKS